MALDKILLDFVTAPPDPDCLWSGKYKIPWDDPAFSRRMLAEHLSQQHDLASRRADAISAQVDWIHSELCGGKPAHLLDIGCGPGLYLEKFVDLGYQCRGIDFSPASIEHARGKLGESAELTLGDVREQEFGTGHGLALMIYGEFNVFSPGEIRLILSKIFASLAPGGKLMIEFQSYETVRGIGTAANSWYKARAGLFSDEPHICLTENLWFQEQAVALQQFVVIAAAGGDSGIFRSTTRAWKESEIEVVLKEAGFSETELQPQWPSNYSGLNCIIAVKPA